jgi:hypothetical protein
MAGNRVTTQLTAKWLKRQALISAIVFLVGFLWFGLRDGHPAWLMIIGGAWYMSVRYRIWWDHA